MSQTRFVGEKHIFTFFKYFGCLTVCVDKAFYKMFTYAAEIKNQLNELKKIIKC